MVATAKGGGTVTAREFGRLVGLSAGAVIGALKRRELPGVQLGRTWRIPVTALERVLRGEDPRAEAAAAKEVMS